MPGYAYFEYFNDFQKTVRIDVYYEIKLNMFIHADEKWK